MRGSIAVFLILALIGGFSEVIADLAPLRPEIAKGERASAELRKRLDLYLRALKAGQMELEELRAMDAADGIWLMERNPFLRARLKLVAILTVREREALINGTTYVSAPYGKLPNATRTLMDEALGIDKVDANVRDKYRYMVQFRTSDGAEMLMISQVDPDGRPRSGGSVMPGVKKATGP